MTEEEKNEIQGICNRIQAGEKSGNWSPIMNNVDDNKNYYYSTIIVDGNRYYVNMERKVIFEDE